MVKSLDARAKSMGFDSPITQHVQRLISRAFMYGAVGSLVLNWSLAPPHNLDSFPSGAFEFNCVITLSKGYVRTIALSDQAIYSLGVCKLVAAISLG